MGRRNWSTTSDTYCKKTGIVTVTIVSTHSILKEPKNELSPSRSWGSKNNVDTLIIPNQNLFVSNEQTSFAEAFRKADNVLSMV